MLKQAKQFAVAQERKMGQLPQVHKKINEFMNNYVETGHMIPIPVELQEIESKEVHYLKWFPVIRKDALTTKVRCVFMANCKTSTGVSLNDTIHPGGKLQTHIFDLMTALRSHKYYYSGDVEKMFCQFLIPEKDRDKLRIIWRPASDQPWKEYWLATVTYGTDCAPWQAIMGLHQIADDNAPDDETKQVIKNKIYMDDVLNGAFFYICFNYLCEEEL